MRQKEKQIQISQTLFLNLVKYHLISPSEDLQRDISKELETKIDNIVKHDLYTKYKVAETQEEREQARKEYLEKIGMRDSFRW